MSLNLKDPETVHLVRELASRTGETLTDTVKTAIQERTARLDLEKRREKRMEWLEELVAYTAPLLKELPPSDKIGDLLFDKETGLPL